MQITVDAGPAQARCGLVPVTLTAVASSLPPNYVIQWVDGSEPYQHLVVYPDQTSQYVVEVLDENLSPVASDSTRVLIHGKDPDLNGDGLHNAQDFLAFLAFWRETGGPADADLDDIVTLLDAFYLCDHDAHPPNTPPTLSVDPLSAWRDNPQTVSYSLFDEEQPNPVLVVQSQPPHGTAFFINNVLYYSPQPGYTGPDSFSVYGFDGTYASPIRIVEVTVSVILYAEVYQSIFSPICGACHIDDMEGGLSLQSYSSTLQGGGSGLPGITPGNLNNSFIWFRVSSNQMPPAPLAPVDDALKELLMNWIEMGAPDN